MSNNEYKLVSFVAVLTGLLIPATAFAYVGPGVGLSALGTIFALLAAFCLAVIGFIWYPIRRVIRKRRAQDSASVSADQSEEPTVQNKSTTSPSAE